MPYVEAGIKAGKKPPPIYTAPFGTLAGGICYDFDFPDFVSHAAWANRNVSILLQPSWTWGPIGERHFAVDALRAVENGATLFRRAAPAMFVAAVVL